MPTLSEQEVAEYVVLNQPQLWAKVYLDWEARDYQLAILFEGKNSKKLVLRLGRRLGKTECMCILILWHAFVQPNKGDNNQYDILIVTPFETQVDLIFDRLHQLIDMSPYFKNSVSRDVYHRLELANGTNITGLTAGSKSGSGAANTRGQRADLIILDEVDYMGSSEITNIINIRNEAPERIKIIAASTPSGRRDDYYKWCQGAVKTYEPSQADIDNFDFTGYEVNTKPQGQNNGWVQVYAPSIVNSELLKMNDDTGLSFLDELKQELTEMRFKQEVLAEFGEEEMGVYQKQHIDYALRMGTLSEHKYMSHFSDEEMALWLRDRRKKILILGVDWDKYSAATNMVIMELDKHWVHPETGIEEPRILVRDRIEIPRSNFTYTNAIERIVELNEVLDFDWISVDRGYGETQIEMLHKYGLAYPNSGFATKVVGYQFSEKIKVRDPYTGKMDKKPLKPFMVNNSVMAFERNAVVLNPQDKHLTEQFEGYRIKSISSTGIPTYNSDNEHGVDALNLALLKFEQEYGDLFKTLTTNNLISFGGLHQEDGIKPRANAMNKTVVAMSKKTMQKIHGTRSGSSDVYLSSPGQSIPMMSRRKTTRSTRPPMPTRGGRF